MGGFGEAGGSIGLLCRPLQRDSGSLRLPLPGEAGLEILYQPQRTWFPSRSKSGFVLFFLSFFLSLSPKLSSPVSRARRVSSPTLHVLAPAAAVFPTPPRPSPGRSSLQSCRRARGGTRGDNPSQPRAGGAGGSWRSGAPGCTSHLQIPESHPCPAEPVPVPKLIPRPSEGKELARGDWRSRARGCSQTRLEGLDVTGEILAWCQQTARRGARLQPPGL